MGLEDYFIAVVRSSEYYESDRNDKARKTKPYYDAEVTPVCHPNKEYQLVIHSMDDIQETICHELLHILLWKFLSTAESIIALTDLDDKQKVELMHKIEDAEHEVIEKLVKVLE